jgi:uncharacterized protein (DUF4415 family)
MSVKSKPSAKPWVDPDDAPEVTEAWLQEADLYEGDTLVRRGRPKAATTKEPVKLRLDADLLAALRATGDGWQTRINDMLRASMHLAGRV